MKRILIVVIIGIVASAAIARADSTIVNKDSKEYKLLVSDSESCSSGTHTSIGSSTQIAVDGKYLCLNEEKPGVAIERGKTYEIRDGKIKKP